MNKRLYLIGIITFLWAGVAFGQSFMIDQVVAIVGSKPIKQSDIEGRYLQYRAQGFPVHGDMKCEMFEMLLTEKLLINQAEVDSLTVESGEVENELNRRLNEFVQQIGSTEALEKYFKKSIYEIKDDLRASLHEQLLAQKMQQNIVENVKITPSEVRAFYNDLPKDNIPLINGQAQIGQITIYPPYSEEAISDMRQKLLDIRKRVIAGESFRTLAVLYSEEPGAASRGGEIGFMSKGELDPEYAKAAWALKNNGDVSRIVQSQFGYHLIQLIDKKGDKVNTRHILMTPKPNPEAIETATAKLDSIINFVRSDSISWKDAALRYSQDDNTRFNDGLLINPRTHSTYFELDQLNRVESEVVKTLKVGEISKPFASRDDKQKLVYKIFRLHSLSDPHRASIKTDYSFLQEMALNQKMSEKIEEWVKEKIETSYIYIDESFKRCGASISKWLK